MLGPATGSSSAAPQFAAMALIGMLLPSAYGLMAGYQLSRLQIENQKLQTERARLDVKEARPLECRTPTGARKNAGLHRPGPGTHSLSGTQKR